MAGAIESNRASRLNRFRMETSIRALSTGSFARAIISLFAWFGSGDSGELHKLIRQELMANVPDGVVVRMLVKVP